MGLNAGTRSGEIKISSLNISGGTMVLNPTGAVTEGEKLTSGGYLTVTVGGETRYLTLFQ